MSARRPLLAIALACAAAACNSSKPSSLTSATAVKATVSQGVGPAVGIALEGVPYPFDLHFLPIDPPENSGGDACTEHLRMAYMDLAPSRSSNGRTVVLLHGKNFYGSYWSSLAHTLSAHGFRVLVPDQIGFGKSSKSIAPYSFAQLARNTIGLLDALHIERADVVGHSMGGMLAVRLALDFSDRVHKVVLEDPIGLEDYSASIPTIPLERLCSDEAGIGEESFRQFMRQYVVEWKPETYEPFVRVRMQLVNSAEFPRWVTASALTYQMIVQQPVRQDFARVQAPVLLVVGQSDRTVVGRQYASKEALEHLGRYPELGRAAAQDLPHAQLLELENVGHIPHLEAPAKFEAAVVGFLRDES